MVQPSERGQARSAEIRKVDERIWHATVATERFGHIGSPNMYVVHGAKTAIIDTGLDDSRGVGAIISIVGQIERPVGAIILTHRHPDHAGGLNALRKVFDVPLIWGKSHEVFDLGDGVQLRIIPTPGHSDDSICVLDQRGNLFTGDTVVGTESVRVSDMMEYMGSLERLLKVGAEKILPGHGEVSQDAMAKIQGTIARRFKRETQILAAVKDGFSTTRDLVDAVYGQNTHRGDPWSEASQVRAHLDKLIQDGKVKRADGLYVES